MPFDALTFPAVITNPTTLFRERRERAAALWATIPAEQWDMALFINRRRGAGCALGHLALHHVNGWYAGWPFKLMPRLSIILGPFASAAFYFGLSQKKANAIFGTERRPAATVAAQLLAAPYVLPAEG